MIISKKHKFIFIHVPKCGGSTIFRCLKDHYFGLGDMPTASAPSKDWIIGRNKKEELNLKEDWVSQHATLKDIQQNLNEDLADYYKFAFVRNPWDRMVSFWKYQYKYYGSFKHFMKMEVKGGDVQSRRLRNSQGKMVINFIGRFENLREDYLSVCKELDIPCGKLRHVNKTNHKHYTEYYDNETISIVEKKFQEDIDNFGYSFGD